MIAQNDRTSNAVNTHQQYFEVSCTFLEEMAINPHQNGILLRDLPDIGGAKIMRVWDEKHSIAQRLRNCK